MRRYYQVTSLLIFAAGVYIMLESRFGLDYYTAYGAGPGFLPFWFGVILTGASLAWLFQVTFRPVESIPKDFYPDRAGTVRVFSVILALVMLTFFMKILGFQLVSLAFLLVLLLTVGKQKPLWAVVLAVVGSWVLTYCFRNLLDVPLPMSSFDFLSNLGL
jgi:putative tricarboxylic transport membrane protein